jgi:hypothetical protein
MTETPRGTRKAYLGDGVYAAFDGYALVLTTEDGLRTTNTVVIEPEVYDSLRQYVEQLQSQLGGIVPPR